MLEKKISVFYHFSSEWTLRTLALSSVQHLNQRINEHRYSAIGKHLETQQRNNKTETGHLFKVPWKCNSKFDCYVYEMPYVKDQHQAFSEHANRLHSRQAVYVTLSHTFFCIAFPTLRIIRIGPVNILCIVHILYTLSRRYTFSLFTLIMETETLLVV